MKVDEATQDAGRRAAIVAAAQECFRGQGVRKTRLDDVAQLVGIARPNLYRYFDSKQAIVAAVNVEESRRINEMRRASIPIEGPVAAIIEKSIIEGVAAARGDAYLMDLMGQDNSALASEALVLSADPRFEYWQPILDHGRQRGEIREGISDAEIVSWLSETQLHFLQNRVLFPDMDVVSARVQRFVVPSIVVSS